MAEQELLLVIESGLEKGPPLAPEPPKSSPAARLKGIDRNQDYWGAVAIEELIPAEPRPETAARSVPGPS